MSILLRHKTAVAIITVGVLVGAGSILFLDSTAHHDPSRRYDDMRAALEAGDFRAANTEFSEIVLELADKTNEGWLEKGDAEAIPCADIIYMDRLFSRYSGGRFGFEAQHDVLKSLPLQQTGDQPLSASPERLVAFGEAVGWRRDGRWLTMDELSFSPAEAPKGELPVFKPEDKIRAPFKSRDGIPEENGALFDLLDERFEACKV